MSLSLYRKYRPENFEKVLGQDHVVTALQSAIKSGNVSHAYLFAGSRGTGKTSVARIFARELGTSQNDIYEIDAASNNSVDQIRELVDGVNTLPFDSKYKVYILDEVHMLSKAAFNALLKTLEEPPAHVIFILATTELHKVLDTVKSRCQVFEFKKPGIETISKMLIEGAKNEGIELKPEDAEKFAKSSDGAFRDAWGVLERYRSLLESRKGSVGEVLEEMFKVSHQNLVSDFVASLVNKDLQSAIEIVNQIGKDGNAMDDFLENVIETFRLVMLARFAPKFADELLRDMNPARVSEIKKWAGEKNLINSDLLVQFLNLLGDVKKSSMPQIPVELALIRILGLKSEE